MNSRAGDREERHARLAGHGAGQQRLARAGRADQQDALGDPAAEPLELLGALEELDDLLQLALGVLQAGDLVERGPLLRLVVPLGRALDEAAEDAAVELVAGPAHHEVDQADDQEGRQEERDPEQAAGGLGRRRRRSVHALARLGALLLVALAACPGPAGSGPRRGRRSSEPRPGGSGRRAAARYGGLLAELAVDLQALDLEGLDVVGVHLVAGTRAVVDRDLVLAGDQARRSARRRRSGRARARGESGAAPGPFGFRPLVDGRRRGLLRRSTLHDGVSFPEIPRRWRSDARVRRTGAVLCIVIRF